MVAFLIEFLSELSFYYYFDFFLCVHSVWIEAWPKEFHLFFPSYSFILIVFIHKVVVFFLILFDVSLFNNR